MSAPAQTQLREIRAEIPDGTFDQLTRALRAGDRGEALAWLDGWPAVSSGPQRLHRHQLTQWVQEECRLHVEGGRLQHALALVERYATLPVPLNKADAEALHARLNP